MDHLKKCVLHINEQNHLASMNKECTHDSLNTSMGRCGGVLGDALRLNSWRVMYRVIIQELQCNILYSWFTSTFCTMTVQEN